MTNRDLEKKVYNALLPVYGSDEATSIQQFLFSALHGLERYQWIMHRDETVLPEFLLQVDRAIPLLVDHMPIQYVIGKTWFLNMEFMVEPGVLIPRPETEIMVTEILQRHKDAVSLNILDIGTGSGAIAVALAKMLNQPIVTGLDISDKALSVASANAKMLNARVKFFKMDILDKKTLGHPEKFNLIVSNPPYVKESEKILMQKNVLEYEPEEALYVPDDDPLKYYKAIAEFSELHLLDSGELWFEINELEAAGVAGLLRIHGFENIHVFKDFNGKDRIVSGCK
ncbi:MAG: peptide chain release factor N(5)-glutamine methyltransferase [Lentimicrobium sp.]|nr:peptide chain release factor N(5)-glutamine methyltransferase [Lentimicrobium sp.]